MYLGQTLQLSSLRQTRPGRYVGKRKKSRGSDIKRDSFSFLRLIVILVLAFWMFVPSNREETIQRRLRHLPGNRHTSYDFKTSFNGAPDCTELTEPEAVSFTLVTQTSEDRLWMLEHFCSVWLDDMSVAVFSNKTKSSLDKNISAMGCDIQRVKTVVLPPEDGTEKGLQQYPVNDLRNRALQQVETSHFLYLDIDFWPSVDLQYVLTSAEVRRDIVSLGEKAALVLPVFQITRQCRAHKECRDNNVRAMPRNRINLVKMIIKHAAFQFDFSNPGGHSSTRYKDWFHQSHKQLLEIPCFKSNRYEPYVVARYCKDLPPFQEAFTGYGRNKMTWTMQLRRMGFRFFQINSFACHYPHLDSTARRAWNGGPNGEQLARPNDESIDLSSYPRGQADLTYLEFKRWMLETLPDKAMVPKCSHAEEDGALWVPKGDLQEFQMAFDQLEQPRQVGM